ncbi:unnamed protein product [Rhizoctonia solani]|uniref:BTB domain-containing protein n=1 Tax=Rhizoctonia solani TaxID=456999 RepID=A0A8H3C3B5_9AGAM|nr:unnamed protein product [Rhizoctonia solani]CAE6472234.1 unnamed protein product [Rhizoctonia solani]
MPQNYMGSLVFDFDGERLFEPGDGDMNLIVNGIRFETHRYLIKRFKKWGDLSKLGPGPRACIVIMGGASAEDFMRMLRVLYSTTLEGPFEFDIPTLVSSLQIATEYEYPALRNYAIKHLKRAELTAIKRIEIARKFDLPSWEKPAFMDLCNRDESITEEEANILGVAAFLRVTEIREREQRRRGSRVDVEREGKAIKSELAEVDLNQGTDGPTFIPCT